MCRCLSIVRCVLTFSIKQSHINVWVSAQVVANACEHQTKNSLNGTSNGSDFVDLEKVNSVALALVNRKMASVLGLPLHSD